MHAGSVSSWNGRPDTTRAGSETRSLRVHNDWLAALPGPILRLEGPATVEANLAEVLRALAATAASA